MEFLTCPQGNGTSWAWYFHKPALMQLPRVDSSTTTLWTGLFPMARWLVSFYYFLLLLLCFMEIPVFNDNSLDPDQMTHSATSDLSVQCLPITLYFFSGL